MTSRKGGYIIIDLTSTTLVDDLSKALGFGKPVLVYNANNEANYYTLTYASGVYTLTGAKDGFTINSEGTITPLSNEVHLYKHQFQVLIDSYMLRGFILNNDSTKLTKTTLFENLDNLLMGAYVLDRNNTPNDNLPATCVKGTNKISFYFIANVESTLTLTTKEIASDYSGTISFAEPIQII